MEGCETVSPSDKPPRSRKAGIAWLKRRLPKSALAPSSEGLFIVLPDDVDLTIRRIRKTDRMFLRYVETFHHIPDSILEPVMRSTLAQMTRAMERWPGRMVCRRRGRRQVEISGETEMATVGDAMAGEFLAWSHLGRMTVTDFLLSFAKPAKRGR